MARISLTAAVRTWQNQQSFNMYFVHKRYGLVHVSLLPIAMSGKGLKSRVIKSSTKHGHRKAGEIFTEI